MKRMLRLTLLVLGALLLAGCGVTPQTVEKVVTQVVKETVFVQGTPQAVEKEVTRVVEVDKVITPTPAPAGPKVLRIANNECTAGTSPREGAATSASMRCWELMHDPLWDRDENGKPIPWLAEKWESNADYSEWTFYLRKGLTFSDGSPLTAEDVKASFEWLGKSELWSGMTAKIKTIEIVDPLTIKFTLVKSMPEFLDLPGPQVQFSIVSKKALEAGADFNKPMQQAYSGPYILKEYLPKDHMVLVKNPHYWKDGYPKFDEIFWRFNPDQTAGVAAVESGQADVFSPVPAQELPRLKLMPNVATYQAKSGIYVGWGFDLNRPPFSDARVRQAMALAVEPDEAMSVCWYGAGDPLYGTFIWKWQTDFWDGYEPYNKPREERLQEAKALLDKAGWVEGAGGMRVAKGIQGVKDGTPFDFPVQFESGWEAAGCHTQLLQNWTKEIGVSLRPERYDEATYWDDVVAAKFQMWHVGMPSWLYAPENLYEEFDTSGTYNTYWFRGSDAEIDHMFDELYATTDLAARQKLVSAINKRVVEQAYIIATGSQNTLVLTTSRLKGFFARSDDSSRALILSDIP